MTDDYDAQKDGHDSYYAAIEAKKAAGWGAVKKDVTIGDCRLLLGDCREILERIETWLSQFGGLDTDAAARAISEARARIITPSPAPSPAADAGAEADEIDALAEYLAAEFDTDMDPVVGASWPQHAKDDGYRGGGYVKLQPADVQDRARDNARRILLFLGRRPILATPSPTAPALVVDEAMVERDEDIIRSARDVLNRLTAFAPDVGVDEFRDALNDARTLLARIDGAE